MGREPGHRAHVATDGVDESGPDRGAYLAHREPPARGRTSSGSGPTRSRDGSWRCRWEGSRSRCARTGRAAGPPPARSRRRRPRRHGWRWSRSCRATRPRSGRASGTPTVPRPLPPRPRRARPRRPPSAKWVQTAERIPMSAAFSRIASCSEGKSSGNELMATTGVTPCMATFSSCLRRLAAPACTSCGRSSSSPEGRGRPATTGGPRRGPSAPGPSPRRPPRPGRVPRCGT